jgi:hypothetical protein
MTPQMWRAARTTALTILEGLKGGPATIGDLGVKSTTASFGIAWEFLTTRSLVEGAGFRAAERSSPIASGPLFAITPQGRLWLAEETAA